MKIVQTMGLAIILCTIFASCQSTSSQKNILSNIQTRNEIMQTIANDTMMSKEMIDTMMSHNNGIMMMHQHDMKMIGNQDSMRNMLKNNKGLMRGMLTGIMETANGDTSMMSGMFNIMKDNPQMMQMMDNSKRNNMMKDNTGNGMMNGMNHKSPMNK
jgi:hypothetical protein